MKTDPANFWLVFAAELTESSHCALPPPHALIYLWETLMTDHLFEGVEVCSFKKSNFSLPF